MRRAQDKILKSIENETSVRIITFKVLTGGSAWLLGDLLTDTPTWGLCLVLVIWVCSSRFIQFFGLGAFWAVLSSAILLVIGLRHRTLLVIGLLSSAILLVIGLIGRKMTSSILLVIGLLWYIN
jgi:hypothetical protein